MQLTLTGKQSSRYVLETSTALPNWTSEVLTVTVTNQNGADDFFHPIRNPNNEDSYWLGVRTTGLK